MHSRVDTRQRTISSLSERPPSVLAVEALVKVHATGSQQVRALGGVELEIGAGEIVALKGPSGSGKTTLLMLCGGLDWPTEGSVALAGQSLAELSDRELTRLRRRELGFVFQFFNLVPGLDAGENVALPLRLDGVDPAEAAERAAEGLRAVGMGHRAEHRVTDLSGGEMQRVAVARALAHGPRLLLADEPTGNLDVRNGDVVLDLIAGECRERGVAALIATHDDRVARRADRIVELRDGRVTADGRPDEILGA